MIRNLIEKVKRTKNPIAYWRSKGATIGERCKIYGSVSLGSEPYLITIGDHVRVSSNTSFITHDGGLWVIRELYDELKNADKFGKIVVGNNVHIGTDCVIMPGVTIGNNCIIGVGAIVTKDIPDNSIAVGVPARVIETLEEYKEKNVQWLEMTKQMSAEEKRAYLTQKYKND